MRIYDIIQKKKEGKELTKEEIGFTITGMLNGSIPDYQISALMMAIFFKGMNERERYDLTMAMRYSGEVMDLSEIPGIKVDKHSTGGVGDKVTLVLGPILASIGVSVAKMSGRGLGHTGGTIDKLEAIPGFNTSLTEEMFIEQVKKIGIALTGQSKDLCPADKKLYALRDLTATVDEMSLITSSIMSKKLAAGTDAIVLDVTVGSGAFMQTQETATELADAMIDIGKRDGKKICAVLTNMDEPLGYAVGNNLEVIEAINALKGNGPKDLMDVVFELGAQMIVFAELASTVEEAKEKMQASIDSGLAFNKMIEFIEAQGGDSSYIKDTSLFPVSEFRFDVKTNKAGYVEELNAKKFGIASMTLGGGREELEDVIDMTVGVVLHKKVGDAVKPGDKICTIHANSMKKLYEAIEILRSAIKISKNQPGMIPSIMDIRY